MLCGNTSNSAPASGSDKSTLASGYTNHSEILTPCDISASLGRPHASLKAYQRSCLGKRMCQMMLLLSCLEADQRIPFDDQRIKCRCIICFTKRLHVSFVICCPDCNSAVFESQRSLLHDWFWLQTALIPLYDPSMLVFLSQVIRLASPKGQLLGWS